MFELLKKLGVPNFVEANWASTIRHEVRVHERYCDLAQFSGTETSDIVYEDHESILTHHLIDIGYLNGVTWAGKSPQYYIEVKSSTGRWDELFFVSGAQYDRVSSCKRFQT